MKNRSLYGRLFVISHCFSFPLHSHLQATPYHSFSRETGARSHEIYHRQSPPPSGLILYGGVSHPFSPLFFAIILPLCSSIPSSFLSVLPVELSRKSGRKWKSRGGSLMPGHGPHGPFPVPAGDRAREKRRDSQNGPENG